MNEKLYGRERICASFMNTKIKGKTLNVGAGAVLWIENIVFKGDSNFISSDIDEKNLGKGNSAKNKMILRAERMPFKNGEISQVIILDVLEHIKEDEKAVKEISRVMKKSGNLVVCVPNDTLLSYLNPVRYVQHERHYTIHGITSLLKKNGFKIEKLFSGGGIFELMNLYIHFFIKYTTGRLVHPSFLDWLRDWEYKTHTISGNEIAIRAIKI